MIIDFNEGMNKEKRCEKKLRLSKQGRNGGLCFHCGKYRGGNVRSKRGRASERIYEVHQTSIILG